MLWWLLPVVQLLHLPSSSSWSYSPLRTLPSSLCAISNNSCCRNGRRSCSYYYTAGTTAKTTSVSSSSTRLELLSSQLWWNTIQDRSHRKVIQSSPFEDMDTTASSSSTVDEGDPRDQWYSSSTTTSMVGSQSALIPLAIVIAATMGIDLDWTNFSTTITVTGSSGTLTIWLCGILCTIPLILLAVVLDRLEDRYPALQDVSDAVHRSVYALLGGTFKPVLAFVTALTLGMVAGLGEELLFRGIIQDTIIDRTDGNTVLGIVASSLIFGLLHAATPLYVVLAMIASIYFGCIYIWFDHNLMIPIICHGLYDFGALWYAHYNVCQLPFVKLQELMVGEGIGTSPSSSE
jgi:membrane protease YdiL (CAAX protease family)